MSKQNKTLFVVYIMQESTYLGFHFMKEEIQLQEG